MSRSINPMSSFKTGTEPFPPSPRSHRSDESATSYSLTSCSPALLVSASPADLHRQAEDVNLSTPAPGIRDSSLDFSCRGKANYQLPGWAKSDDRSGPGRTIKLSAKGRFIRFSYWTNKPYYPCRHRRLFGAADRHCFTTKTGC
jgi:hypothetical protein